MSNKTRLPIHAVEDAATQRALRAVEEAINNGVGTIGADGADGAAGPPGPAPSGTGLVRVTGGVIDARAELSGDVSTSGALVTAIGNNKVTLAMLADIATASFLGRTTAGTGDPEVLTATQATAILNVFTSALKGLVPASGGSASEALFADGTFKNPVTTFASIGWPRMGIGSAETMDGSTAVTGCSRSGSVYTATQHLYFTSLTIDSGVTLKLVGYKLFVGTTLTVNGAISADGGDGALGVGGTAVAAGFFAAGSNGAAAGASGTASSGNKFPAPVGVSSAGTLAGTVGVAGGNGDVPCRGGGGGGAALTNGGGVGVYSAGTSSSVCANAMEIWLGGPNGASSSTLRWAAGFGGGGGGGGSGGATGGGGGAGGGVVWIDCVTLTGTGTISSNGGNGAAGTGTNGGGGGGGGGGWLGIWYGTRAGSLTITVTGGAGGAAAGVGGAGGTGHDGLTFLFNTTGDGT